MASSVRTFLDLVPSVGHTARSEAENLGRVVLQLDSYLPGLVSGTISAASRSSMPSTQLVYLDHACTVFETTEQLLRIAKDAGGNPKVWVFF